MTEHPLEQIHPSQPIARWRWLLAGVSLDRPVVEVALDNLDDIRPVTHAAQQEEERRYEAFSRTVVEDFKLDGSIMD